MTELPLPTGDQDRAQTQVGVLLVALLVVVVVVVAQTQYAPAERAETEAEHSVALLEDMKELQVSTLQAAQSGATQSVPVELGSQYSSFLILSQPANYPWGTIETTNETEIGVLNAEAVRDDTRDYLDGSPLIFNTAGLRYSPEYLQRDEPATELRNGILAQGDGTMLTGSNLVDGQQINIIAVDGNVSEAGQRAAIMVADPLSSSDQTVPVESANGDPIEIRLQTQLSEEKWRQALSEEIDPDCSAIQEPYVCGVSVEDNVATITLAPGPTYQLNTALVGYRTVESAGGAGKTPEAEYLVRTDTQLVGQNEVEVTVEARDKFSNPVQGAVIEADARSGRLSEREVRTDASGEATFRVSTGASSTNRVELTIEGVDGEQATVTFEITG
ncbi:Ig-like domain-containing protein [Halorubrum sp. Atlit-26R]|uniref:Ig-like domain-containing protein n=1 Tax=Halorubrum sp. Atlit-26R TaxID=2282128 RepID=UPI000EF19FB5|nr:Ig-like domain-containing protein [Halorubrum sp. Atlit-26R]RLM68466.1 hypothetical protein DVK07_10095 [Halorubrum sp. Atlit-26R]